MERSFAAKRRGFAVFACLMLALASAQVQAQSCTGTPQVSIDPASQTVPESIPGTPTTVRLTAVTNKTGATYSWVQTAGPAVTLVPGSTVASPTFTAPSVGATKLEFRLTVRCSTGNAGIATTVVNVTDVVTNAPPTAVASATPAIAQEGTVVTLDGSASYDINPGTTLTYSWTQTGIGPTSPAVTLTPTNAAGSIVTFTAPNTPLTTGAVLTFRLTVSDGTLTGIADQSVNIVWTNDPPIASLACPAGGVLVVDEGDLVQLDGTGSTDSDGSIVGYRWSQAVGLPNLGLGALDTPSIAFYAPALGYQQLGNVAITLTVTDDVGATADSTCVLFINDVTPPAIDVPASVTLEAESAAGTAFSYSATVLDAVDHQVPQPLACDPPSGSTFPLAAAPGNQTVTQVSCSAQDSAGNQGSAGFSVTVQDTTAPEIQVPGSHAVESQGPGGAIADYGPIATTDAVDGAGTATCLPASGTLFPNGETAVQCTAVDARGNGSQAGFVVVVHDLTPPAFGPAPDVLAEAQSAAGASVAYALPVATDLVDGEVAVGCIPAPGSTFAIGSTGVTCSASDLSGNSAQVQFNVIVADTTPPVLTLPSDITAEATSAAGAAVSFIASALDLVDGNVAVACLPASGSVFPLGSTEVSCSATDARGNSATASFGVEVVDSTPPVIEPYADVGPIEATSPAGAQVFYGAPATSDAVDGPGIATCAPPSASIFPLGLSVVTCTAQDAAGNTAVPTSFNVTVHDTTAPVVTAPPDVGPVEATAPLTPVDPGTATAVDAVGVVSQSSDAPVPAAFPVGVTTITWSAQDAAGNTGTASSTVTVVDTTAPALSGVSGDIGPVQATSPGGAVVAWTAPTAIDLVDGSVAVACTPASGSAFAIGTTSVTCSARDSAVRPGFPEGNVATQGFSVTVVDTAPPVLAGVSPDLTVEAASAAGTVVTWPAPTAVDVVDGDRPVGCSPASGSLFPFVVGGPPIQVTCSSSDTRGNSASAGFTVSVLDRTKPVISGATSQTLVATSPAGAVATFAPTAHDTVDPSVAVVCSHQSGDTFAPGNTVVQCTATDDSGNQASASFTISVRYAWSDFLRPIDNLPLTNTVKAGSGIPVKFSLGGNMGLSIIESGYPRSVRINCVSDAPEAEVETTVNAGGSSLTYDATANQYVYVWKTDKAWAGTCRQLQLQLADGSAMKLANFKFTK